MRPVDLSQVRTIPLQTRQNKVARERFARPAAPGRSFAEFLDALPNILAGEQFRVVVDRIVAARKRERPVIVSIGGHVVKCGIGTITHRLDAARHYYHACHERFGSHSRF